MSDIKKALREIERFLEVIERAEKMQKVWEILTIGTNIETANGYRNAIKILKGKTNETD